MRLITFIAALLAITQIFGQENRGVFGKENSFYVIEIEGEISASSARRLSKGLKESLELNSKWVIIHMNTYGGAVDAADSMRSAILYHPVPVVAFIDNQAVSAGALISIACDSIYMRVGGTIGAATVVNQSGEPMPDKYQSFMRSMMRATAEVTGRDPQIAEAMVDGSIVIPDIVESGKILSFTSEEAMVHGYCEGIASSVEEVVVIVSGSENNDITHQRLTTLEKIILFMMTPLIQGILLMLIIGGIYFELQTPGMGFPSIVAVMSAVLYFSPLYLEGIAQYWEILLFIAGVILILVEVFVTPGFGVLGVLGIILSLCGLSFAMVDNNFFHFNGRYNFSLLLRPFSIVLLSTFLASLSSIFLAGKFLNHERLPRISLATSLKDSEGFVGVESNFSGIVGKEALVRTAMYPAGKIEIDGKWYEATMEIGSAGRGDRVVVTRYEGGRLYCEHPAE